MYEPRRSEGRDTLLAAVKRLHDTLAASAEESDRRRTLAPAALDALRGAGLFAIAAPRAVGGLECDPVTQMEVFEATARADTAAGWCLMIGSLTIALAGAYLPDAGVKRIFAGPFPIGAGLVSPQGVARRAPGGYVVSGRWGFGSGIRHADWVLTGALVEPQDPSARSGPPTMISVAVPVSQVHIEDTWETAGLRGSGSEHYRMEGVFVPEELTCPFPAAPQRRGGPLFRLPMLALLTSGHVGFALGGARQALDEITQIAPRRVNGWTQIAQGSHAGFQMDLGRAEAKLMAARAYAVSVLEMTWARALSGEALALEDWSAIRLVTTYVTEVAAEVSAFAYRSGGGSALYTSSPLQRIARDLQAAAQHVAATDDAYEFMGKVRLGLAEPAPMLAPRPSA